jgi:serine/threonine-protein kinase
MVHDRRTPDPDTISHPGQPYASTPTPPALEAAVPEIPTQPMMSGIPLQSPEEPIPLQESETSLTGVSLGPYVIQDLLGRGGMGSIYRAVRVDDYHQVVAIKFIRRDQGSYEILRRFHTERQVLAGLSHPNIVRLLDGGMTEDGRPYFVMEYVQGRVIDACEINGHAPTLLQRVRLFQLVCEAIHYAHTKGVLHRDLKPSNVLVTGEGIPKVTDFGLAKQLETLPGPAGGLTQTGAIIGTPNYMSPEQAGGRTKAIGIASDVYSLGALLYELLTGRPPFRAESPVDTLMQVMTEEPVAPCRLDPSLPRDLETICLKCLEKNPGRRYVSAEALANDVNRFLEGRPVEARPIRQMERLARWSRRNPLTAGLVATLFLVLICGIAGTTYLWRLAVARGERADAAVEQAIGVLEDFSSPEQFSRGPRSQAEQQRRRESLEIIIRHCESLRERHDDSFQLLHRLAYSLMQLEEVCRNLGDRESAIAAGLRAVELLTKLAQEDETHERLLAWAYANLAMNESDSVEEYENRSLAIRQKLRERHPQDGYELGMAYTYVNRGLRLAAIAEKREEAFRLLDQARQWREESFARHPDNRENDFQLGKVYEAMGRMYWGDRDPAKARHWLQQAFDHFERAARRHPNDPAFVANMASCLEMLSLHLPAKESIPLLQRTTAVMREALLQAERNSPEVRAALDQLGRHLYNLGVSQAEIGNTPESKALTRKTLLAAREILEKLKPVTPASDQLWYELAFTYHNLGETEKWSEKLELEKLAITTLDAFVAANPDLHSQAADYGRLLQNYAEYLARDGRYEEAIALLKRAVQQQQRAILKAPQEDSYLKNLAEHYCALAEVQARPEEPLQAAAWEVQQQQRTNLLSLPAPHLQALARQLSRLIARVGKEEEDELIPEPVREKRRQLLGKLAEEVRKLANP